MSRCALHTNRKGLRMIWASESESESDDHDVSKWARRRDSQSDDDVLRFIQYLASVSKYLSLSIRPRSSASFLLRGNRLKGNYHTATKTNFGRKRILWAKREDASRGRGGWDVTSAGLCLFFSWAYLYASRIIINGPRTLSARTWPTPTARPGVEPCTLKKIPMI